MIIFLQQLLKFSLHSITLLSYNSSHICFFANVCKEIGWLFLNVNITLCHSGVNLAGPKWCHLGEANSNGVPHRQICKQSWVKNLSLYKHCFLPARLIHKVQWGIIISEHLKSSQDLFKWFNRTESIRHLCRKTAVSSCHRCLITLVLTK